MERMTVEELAALPGVHVGTREAAAVLGCDRYSLNIAAKQGTLNIAHTFVGNRLKISKAALLEYCGYIKSEKAPQAAKPKSSIWSEPSAPEGADRSAQGANLPLSIVFSKGVRG